jgi:hypothetical protein
MTEETQIEEILMEANSVGVRSEVIDVAHSLMMKDKDLDRVDAFQRAYEIIVETVNE